MDLVDSDKKAVTDVSKRVQMTTTVEGAEALWRAIVDACRAIVERFQKLLMNLEAKLVECFKAAGEFEQRAANTRSDGKVMETTARQARETRRASGDLYRGKRVAGQEVRFLDSCARQEQRQAAAAKRSVQKQRDTLRNSAAAVQEINAAVRKAQKPTTVGTLREISAPEWAKTSANWNTPVSKNSDSLEARVVPMEQLRFPENPRDIEARLNSVPRTYDDQADPSEKQRKKGYGKADNTYIDKVPRYKDKQYNDEEYK